MFEMNIFEPSNFLNDSLEKLNLSKNEYYKKKFLSKALKIPCFLSVFKLSSRWRSLWATSRRRHLKVSQSFLF